MLILIAHHKCHLQQASDKTCSTKGHLVQSCGQEYVNI